MFKFLRNLGLFCLCVIPFLAAGAPLILDLPIYVKLIFLAIAPISFMGCYLLVCITFARIGVKAIVAGKFPRDIKHQVYGPRSVFGTMWTAIYYFKPLYWALLANDTSKAIMLRGFGYKGSLKVTLYPDTWIRDLPLLVLKDGAYLANRATIGTNIVMKDGRILVEGISVGERSIVGHLAVLACGAYIGDFSEIGSAAALGIKARVGDNCSIGPRSDLNHAAYVANGTKTGACSYLGIKSQILGEGITVPAHACIPGGTIIETQQDVSRMVESETTMLSDLKLRMSELISRSI